MKYKDKYYLHRKLKPFVDIDSSIKTIFLPQDLNLTNLSKSHIDLLCSKYGYQVQLTIPCEKYQKIIYKRNMCVRSLKMNFKAVKFLGLVPGTHVTQIGAGSITKTNHIDKFNEPYIYRGLVMLNDWKFYAFEIPKSEAPKDDYTYYVLYEYYRDEIRKAVYKKHSPEYVRCYKSVFKIIDNPKLF